MAQAGKEKGPTAKGGFGEEAPFKICERRYQSTGGILYHSYTYKTDKSKKGNIYKDESGRLYVENLGPTTEIDVLYVSPNRVFPIEVKAYRADKILLTDDGISGAFKTNKSPVHQNEMHCRHLYPIIYRVLPEGQSRYIVPIVCFVDRCTLEDKRSDWQFDYILSSTLNNLNAVIDEFDIPQEYLLDIGAIERVLRNACVKSEKHLPLRIV